MSSHCDRLETVQISKKQLPKMASVDGHAQNSSLKMTKKASVVPWLTTAPHLIYYLGCCMALASTRQVASRIRLTEQTLKYI